MKTARALEAYMLRSELIDLVRCQSARLSDELFLRFSTAAQYSDLQKIPTRQLRAQAQQLCQRFVEWASTGNDDEVEACYVGLGVDRQSQGVALSHLIASLHLTRDHMLACAEHVLSLDEREAYAEFVRALNEFFDRVITAVVVGYDRAQSQERRQLWAS
jgi:hypothetical protein